MAWAPDYCTAAELKAFVRITDSADDAQVALAIAAASRAVDRATGRQFGLVASVEARYYTPRYDALRSRWSVPIDDLMTIAGLLAAFDEAGDGTYSAAITDYVLRPVNAAPRSRPWTELAVRSTSGTQPTNADACVRVTARWGWSAVPDAVKEATLLQASRFLVRRDSPYGVAGSPEAGSELRLLAAVDPDVAVALRDYRRGARWVFA
jgi:hypothetical protein